MVMLNFFFKAIMLKKIYCGACEIVVYTYRRWISARCQIGTLPVTIYAYVLPLVLVCRFRSYPDGLQMFRIFTIISSSWWVSSGGKSTTHGSRIQCATSQSLSIAWSVLLRQTFSTAGRLIKASSRRLVSTMLRKTHFLFRSTLNF